MGSTITISSFIIPTLLFVFALYIGVVPNPQHSKSSLKRTIFCGIGIAFGLFQIVKVIVSSSGYMYNDAAFKFVEGLIILGWSIYAYVTRTSTLSRGRKIIKAIIYWIITGCFVGCISPVPSMRSWNYVMMFILPILAYYGGVVDKDPKDQYNSNAHKMCNLHIARKVHLNLNSAISFLCRTKKAIAYFWTDRLTKKQRKVTLIIIGILILLIVLPYLARLYDAYMDYFYDVSGHKRNIYHYRHRIAQ